MHTKLRTIPPAKLNAAMVFGLGILLLLVKPGLIGVAEAAHGFDPEPSVCEPASGETVIKTPTLTVLTLNLAHGRKDAFNQMLQRTSTTRRNLEDIAAYFIQSGADVIALQEADSPSRWSGKFNHVDHISDKSPYKCSLHAHHAHKYMYDFGTALISKVPYSDSLSHTFVPSPPTTNKGFVMGKILWNPNGQFKTPITVTVISVHLDFSRKKVRESQTQEIREVLADIEDHVIILGDFNTDWSKDKSALKSIVDKGSLRVWEPLSDDYGTYKDGKHRLDWILISKDLEFSSYEVPEVLLSDHQPVLASIRLAGVTGRTTQGENK